MTKQPIHPNPQWQHAQWQLKIVQLAPHQFQAELWLYDEYDDYLAIWECYRKSGIFPTEEASIAYAMAHWDGKDIEE